MRQAEAYETFKALHEGPDAFIMPNAWDGASAALLKRAGFKALGSTSAAIAFGLGLPDGAAAVGREVALDNAAMLCRVSGLPVNGDLEDGFGPDPEDCAATVEAAIEAGLAGLGIEDTTSDPGNPIHDFDHAVARMRAAGVAAQGRILLTGRTDNFLHGRPDLDDTIRRLVAFAEVGADVLYAPALPDMAAVKAVIRAVAPKPVNILLGPFDGFVPLSELTAVGARRISTGGALYLKTMAALDTAAREIASGNPGAATGGLKGAELMKLFP